MKYARPLTLLTLAASAFTLTACNKEMVKDEPIRLVRAVQVGTTSTTQELSFAGEVRPRYETALGFRVGGKIIAREVEVGSVVKAGQVLARLDPRDLQLGVQALVAEAAAARTQAALAQADYQRFADLRGKNFISQAEYERHKANLQTARERVAGAQAQLSQARNQASYSALIADHAGVVTALQAEVGQVVQAGQPVARVARLEEKEIVISVPEQQAGAIKNGKQVAVGLWAHPGKTYQGEIREMAPSTDPATRTYLVKVAVKDGDDALRLGMTAEVKVSKPNGDAVVLLPLSAIYTKTDLASVWVVDPANSKVRQVVVQTGGVNDNHIVITSGLKPGDTVVTAGANLLIPGQQVRLAQSAGTNS